jgi:hypothetical protein
VDDDDAWFGHTGPLHIVNTNFNGPDSNAMIGAGFFQANIKDGLRFGTAQAYLFPALLRSNLTS